MKFTHQFSNTTPCQSDVAADEWERLAELAEGEAMHRDRMADNAMDFDHHWYTLRDELLDREELVSILDTLREHSQGGNRDLSTYYDMAVKLLGIFDDMVVDTIDDEYESLKDSLGE
jgi:hypothetical protein